MPDTAQEIRILNSNIPSLPERSFAKFRSLKYLEITRSQLSDIRNGAFAGLPALEVLVIVENKITTVQENWIKDIPTLKVLKIWKNEIKTIESGVFKHLGRLEILDIAHNKLTNCLAIDHLKELTELKSLYITGNRWPLRCRPDLVFYLTDRHVNLVHNWGTKYLIIADCIAHHPGAQDNDNVLQDCYDLSSGDRLAPPTAITGL